MINSSRIVPATALSELDYMKAILTVWGTASSKTFKTVSAADAEGDFDITTTAINSKDWVMCDEPAKHINFGSGVSAAIVFFVPTYDYEGFSLNGTATTPTGTVDPDGRTLYKATLSSGTVTIVEAF